MPLPSPILDDRSYEQLRDELVRRIPVYAPEWTDHNASDPGIALIELFAFLGENLLYRFNQIPETTNLAFLRLLQVPLRPAAPARALVCLTTEQAGGALVPLGTELKAGALPFETQTEAMVWPVSFQAVARSLRPAPDATAEPEVYEHAVRAVDALGGLAADQEPVYYQNETVPPLGDGPSVDFGATVDGMLWVAVLRGKGTDPSKLGGALLNLGFVPDSAAPAPADVAPCPGAGTSTPSPAVEWQVSTPRDQAGTPVYLPIRVEGDGTRGLGQEGVMRLRLPAAANLGLFVPADPDLGGTGQFPPALDDPTAKDVLFWLRAFRRDGSHFGRVRAIVANAVEARQVKTAGLEFVGVGNAQAHQRFTLAHTPVIDGSLTLEVEEAGGWRSWQQVDGFFASTESDRHYVLDPAAGEVRFGTVVQGSAPQIGQRIRAVRYLYGGGAEGNVPPKAINAAVGQAAIKTVFNPLRAGGGAPAEAIEAALERIPGELRRHDRAVTAGDFRELALATPGADVGRAECLPRFYPPTRATEAAGVVSVIVWPREDPQHPGAPLPSRALLRAVCSWLDARRLVTTELYVIPPSYRKVAVAVGLQVKPGYGVEAVRHWVELVIHQYLAPLPPFGPSGAGWPLGRRVHGPELEAAALQVEGVEFLNGLQVAGWDATQDAWVPGSVDLESFEVPELVDITVVDGDPLPPGQAIGPPPSAKTPVPVPIIRQEC
jgi:hypothetical protein